MVIHKTEESGESRSILAFAHGLSWENERAERVRQTPVPQATPIRPNRTEGALAR
jgi:hypothetical protein